MKKLSNTSEDILTCARALIVAGGYNGFSYACLLYTSPSPRD